MVVGDIRTHLTCQQVHVCKLQNRMISCQMSLCKNNINILSYPQEISCQTEQSSLKYDVIIRRQDMSDEVTALKTQECNKLQTFFVAIKIWSYNQRWKINKNKNFPSLKFKLALLVKHPEDLLSCNETVKEE